MKSKLKGLSKYYCHLKPNDFQIFICGYPLISFSTIDFGDNWKSHEFHNLCYFYFCFIQISKCKQPSWSGNGGGMRVGENDISDLLRL